MRVAVPDALTGYTGGAKHVEAEGATVAELLDDMDRRYAGVRFRMVNERGQLRPHMRIFVNREMVEGLDQPVSANDEVVIIQALSGG